MKHSHFGFHEYITPSRLFTAVVLPEPSGQFPTLIIRTPYVTAMEKMSEEEAVATYLPMQSEWLENGYAVVIQHCRGCGKSGGDFIPYEDEKEDGLALQDWIRKQPFYNGELYLYGSSYLSVVQYLAAPYGEDIKGAIFSVADSNMYNFCYRNGFLKAGLLGSWYSEMYKARSLPKNYVSEAMQTLPLSAYSQTIFGENSPLFDEILKHPDPTDSFWATQMGGTDVFNAVQNAQFPVLLTTGLYDLFTGGIITMWNRLDETSKQRSALLVSAYEHSDAPQCILFPDGKRTEHFGANYEIQWINSVRGLAPCPFPLGTITYYSLFDNQWRTGSFQNDSELQLTFGSDTRTYTYNPYAPASFQGGLCCNFGGTAYQDPPNSRYDIISVYSEPFEEDTLVRGRMTALLQVASDCEDTCFYTRLSITTEEGDFGLRDDITSICLQHPDYVPGTLVPLRFTFDEHAFLIQKGARIRLDISSADAAHYVRHANQKGLFSTQTTAKIAHNTVALEGSFLTLPTVKGE